MVDDKQVALVGMAEVLSKEIAFIIDRYCQETAASYGQEYDDVYDALLREVEKVQLGRQHDEDQNHPIEDNVSSSDSKTPAELALYQALTDIHKMKAEKAEKAEKKKKKKKKDNKKKKRDKDD